MYCGWYNLNAAFKEFPLSWRRIRVHKEHRTVKKKNLEFQENVQYRRQRFRIVAGVQEVENCALKN